MTSAMTSKTADRRFPRAFPGGKRFAFTIVDDTDFSDSQTVSTVYRFLLSLGIRTTKTVWPLEGEVPAMGTTLQDPEYRHICRALQNDGVELALHNVQNSSARREQIESGLNAFEDLTGRRPTVHINHENNLDNLYWGVDRLTSGLSRTAYRCFNSGAKTSSFGHMASAPFFWGDLCQQRIRYVRNFVYPEVNLASIDAGWPYCDTAKPYVRAWFNASDGEDVVRFCNLLSEANQDRLETESGVCIVYTHFAYGFQKNGVLNPRFEHLMRRLAAKNAWFVPVSDLLDHLSEQRGNLAIKRDDIIRMERLWLAKRLLHRKLINPNYT